MLKKLAVISLTAGVLVLSAPTAVSAAPASPGAASASYADPPTAGVDDPIVDICELSTVVFGPGYFLPDENVTVAVSGLNADRSEVSGTVAAADGSLVLTFRPPSDGEGSYAIAFDGSRSYTAQITVSHGHDAAVDCDHDPGVSPAVVAPAAESGPLLALTGGAVSAWMIGGGIAAVAAGTTLWVRGTARRKRT